MPPACASRGKGCERTILSGTKTTEFRTINSTHDSQSQRRILSVNIGVIKWYTGNNTPETQSKTDTFK